MVEGAGVRRPSLYLTCLGACVKQKKGEAHTSAHFPSQLQHYPLLIPMTTPFLALSAGPCARPCMPSGQFRPAVGALRLSAGT